MASAAGRSGYISRSLQYDFAKIKRDVYLQNEFGRFTLNAEKMLVPARTEDEPRFIIIGQIDARHWSAVITYRSDDIRIISVRRSREEEVVLYES